MKTYDQLMYEQRKDYHRQYYEEHQEELREYGREYQRKKKAARARLIEEIRASMCDSYCRFPLELDSGRLADKCEGCPMGRLEGDRIR